MAGFIEGHMLRATSLLVIAGLLVPLSAFAKHGDKGKGHGHDDAEVSSHRDDDGDVGSSRHVSALASHGRGR